MEAQEFEAFFSGYSKNVDKAEDVGFWKFSDALVERILLRHLPKSGHPVILDAGGGTGRWIVKLSRSVQANYILYDLSHDMINQARSNLRAAGLDRSVRIIQGNLENMAQISSESVDAIVSLYAPIGFTRTPAKAVAELSRILRKDGVLCLMGHGYHNALYSKFCNYKITHSEANRMAKQYRVKWDEYVPDLHTFSQERMIELFSGAGLSTETVYGLPVLLQPGAEDFDPTNVARSMISKQLEDEIYFDTALDLEMSMNSEPTVVNRGVNILGVARKN